MHRDCPVCQLSTIKHLYQNQMAVLGGEIDLSYNVVMCQNCGMVYASNLPPEEVYSRYYSNYSKYDSSYRHDEIYDKLLLRDINKSFPKEAKIFDVGCSVGLFLKKLQDKGFLNLCGVEPSSQSKQIIKNNYGIDILTGFFGKELCQTIDVTQINCFIIASVLEHIKNLDDFLEPLKETKEGNIVYAVVPNVDYFPAKNNNEIFYEFSCEHINYFSRNSLNNLMSKYGYKNIKSYNQVQPTGSYNLVAKYIKTNHLLSIKSSFRSSSKINKYIQEHEEKLKSKLAIFDGLSEIIIFGAGSHTLRFLPYIEKVVRVKYVIDDNPNLVNKTIGNYKILPVKTIIGDDTPIFLSTSIYLEEMKQKIGLLSLFSTNHKTINFYS